MTVVALALAAALIVASLVFAQALRSLVREQARERALLINQILHATGKPWQPAPADTPEPVMAADVEPEHRYVTSPEQFV